MSITAGSTILATDFVSTTSGASDFGKVVKLDATGKIPTGGFLRFGGTGADGALSVSSGTTSIDLAGARFVIKNYSSISITGTGAVNFINPHANGSAVVLKAQGDVVLTSSATPMLSVVGIGAAKGAGATGSGGTGTVGSTAIAFVGSGGAGGGGGVGGSLGAGGALGPVATLSTALNTAFIYKGMFYAACGGGGGGGGAQAADDGGDGGNGGGILIIECAGALNFTTASGISVAGATGSAGVGSGSGSRPGSGGGGGGGGTFICLYNTLTAASGTVVITGGSGGAGGTAPGSGGNWGQAGSGAGGGGASTAGTVGVTGNTVTAATAGAAGATGGTGFSIIAPNVEFA